MKRTEQHRLEDEVIIYEDNKEFLDEFAIKFIKQMLKRNPDLNIELISHTGGMNPEIGEESHKLIFMATRRYEKFSKGTVDSYRPAKQLAAANTKRARKAKTNTKTAA